MMTSNAPQEKSYVGTKIVRAIPMTENYFLSNVKHMTAQELHNRETQGDGYQVTYEDGYVSWSPKAVFERCYREISTSELKLIMP